MECLFYNVFVVTIVDDVDVEIETINFFNTFGANRMFVVVLDEVIMIIECNN